MTVDLRGAVRSFVTEAYDGLMVNSLTFLADPLNSRDARAAVLRTVSATPGGRNMATGQPSLITTRC